MGVNQFSNESHLESLLKSDTSKISEKTVFKNGIQVTILKVSELNESDNIDDADILQEIKKKFSGFDLFLYCINSIESNTTVLFDENSSLVKLTKVFGMKLWKNAVVVLTKTNVIVDGLKAKEHDPRDVEKLFRQKISDWKVRVHRELQNLGIKKPIIKRVPVLPAGNLSLSLPGHPFWLSKIFGKSLDQINYKAKIAYLKLASDRLILRKDTSAKNPKKEMYDQPLVISQKGWVPVASLSVSGVGAASAIVGVGIGSVVGTVALGIPTFGVGSLVGLVIGGAIGGAIGTGSAIGTALAIKHFKRRKAKSKK